ncbi:Uncharacterised protein [Neisseria meningitidis]|nr:Uncharacterised protein [Neisseria meningitidis]
MRNKPFDVVNHFLHKRLSVQIIPNGLVHTGVRPQLGIVIRVGQTAHIEHKIRVVRHTVFEPEGLQNYQQPGTFDLQPLPDCMAELLGIHLGSVDTVGDFLKRKQPFPFFL